MGIHWYVAASDVSYRGIGGTRMGSVGIYVVFRCCDSFGVLLVMRDGERISCSLVRDMGRIVLIHRRLGYLGMMGRLPGR